MTTSKIVCAGCGGPYDDCDCPCGSITITSLSKCDRLKRLAELAGIPWLEAAEFWLEAGRPDIAIIVEGGRPYLYDQTRDVMIEWTLNTALGRLVIADRLMQGPNWKAYWFVQVVSKNNAFVIFVSNGEVRKISYGQTWADAVIAAMEGTHE